ncbi:hypothetical protein AK812_SmicGene4291 [Symbiodinium microadriaticum]|uniref:Ubiquitin-like domain-containing protein n=1 Tax=Symbiodinium microadriaticum TaxID=2951 RepID=A0A1Q9EWW6_SYMMI|nr:hypothetical protein AK812_SmicGene4291 [Symbiodinium microadriaticum]
MALSNESESVLRVYGISGEIVASLDAEERAAMSTEFGNSVGALKELLQLRLGTPRFRIRLLCRGCLLENDESIFAWDFPKDVQVVLVPVRAATEEERGQMFHAIRTSSSNQVEALLHAPLDPDSVCNQLGQTALIHAAPVSSAACVRSLLEARAGLDKTDRQRAVVLEYLY